MNLVRLVFICFCLRKNYVFILFIFVLDFEVWHFYALKMKFLFAFLCNLILLVKCDSPYHLNCDSNPCGNGKCIDLYQKTAYQCECDTGWEGKNCNHKSLLQKENHYNYNFNDTQEYGKSFSLATLIKTNTIVF